MGVNSAPSFTSANTTTNVSTSRAAARSYLPSSTALHNATSDAPDAVTSRSGTLPQRGSAYAPMVSSQETEGTALHNPISDVPPVTKHSGLSSLQAGITSGLMVTGQETGAVTSQPSGSSVFNMSESFPGVFSSSFLDVSHGSSRLVSRVSNSESLNGRLDTGFPDFTSSLKSTNLDIGGFVSAISSGALFTSQISFEDKHPPIGTFSLLFSHGALHLSLENMIRNTVILSLPRPLISSTSQYSDLVNVSIDESILPDPSSTTGFLIHFKTYNAIQWSIFREIPRSLTFVFKYNCSDAIFLFQKLNSYVKSPLVSKSHVAVTVTFAIHPDLYSTLRPSYVLLVLHHPVASSLFANQMLTWSQKHADSCTLDFKISMLSRPGLTSAGRLRAYSICGMFASDSCRSTCIVFGTSFRSRSGVSPEVNSDLRYDLQPRFHFSGASFGLAPPVTALLSNFPIGLGLPGFQVHFLRIEHLVASNSFAFIKASSVPIGSAVPLIVNFRTHLIPDFCMPSGRCCSYQDSVCVDHSISRKIKSVANPKVQYLPFKSGPTEPNVFIDGIGLYVSKIDLSFLEPKYAFGSMSLLVLCNSVPNVNDVLVEVNVFDGITTMRIPAPKGILRTHFGRLVQFSDFQTSQFAHRANVSAAYDAFDDLRSESTACKSGELVTFLVSSITDGLAVIAFGPNAVPASSVIIKKYPVSDDAVVTARLHIFTRYVKRPRVCRIVLRLSCRVLHHCVLSLQCFPLVDRSIELHCSMSSASACSEQLNASSTVTFIQIGIHSFGGSTHFQSSILSPVGNVADNDDSVSFRFSVLSSPAFDVLTATSFQISFSAFHLEILALSCSFYVYDQHNSFADHRFRAAQTRFFLSVVGSVTDRAFFMSAFKYPLASWFSVTAPPFPVFTAGSTAPQLYQITFGAFVEKKVDVVLTLYDPARIPIATPIFLPKSTRFFMLVPVEPGNTGNVNDQVDNHFIQKEPLFHLTFTTTLLPSFLFVCIAVVNLWHHVRDLALVGIPIFAAFSAMTAWLGSRVAGRCHRKCTTSSRQCVVVSSGMQSVPMFACQGRLKKYAAHAFACAESSTGLRRINPSEGTLPSALEHRSTTARMHPCALFGLESPALAFILTMSLLLFPMIAAQTCANPTLGQARLMLAAASLPSGLVFFAGGQSDSGASAYVDMYNSTSNRWTTFPSGLGEARYGLAAASLPSGLVFFAGGAWGIETILCVRKLCRVSCVTVN